MSFSDFLKNGKVVEPEVKTEEKVETPVEPKVEEVVTEPEVKTEEKVEVVPEKLDFDKLYEKIKS